MSFITSKTLWQPVYEGDWNDSSCPLGTHLCNETSLLSHQELKFLHPFNPGCGQQDTHKLGTGWGGHTRAHCPCRPEATV